MWSHWEWNKQAWKQRKPTQCRIALNTTSSRVSGCLRFHFQAISTVISMVASVHLQFNEHQLRTKIRDDRWKSLSIVMTESNHCSTKRVELFVAMFSIVRTRGQCGSIPECTERPASADGSKSTESPGNRDRRLQNDVGASVHSTRQEKWRRVVYVRQRQTDVRQSTISTDWLTDAHKLTITEFMSRDCMNHVACLFMWLWRRRANRRRLLGHILWGQHEHATQGVAYIVNSWSYSIRN